MKYTKLEDLQRKQAIACDELPFLKRWPYGDEREFRVVYTNLSETVAAKRLSDRALQHPAHHPQSVDAEGPVGFGEGDASLDRWLFETERVPVDAGFE